MHPSHVLSRLSSTLINCQATYSQEAYEVKTKKKKSRFHYNCTQKIQIVKAAKQAETHSSCKQIWMVPKKIFLKNSFFKDIECQSKSAYRFPFLFFFIHLFHFFALCRIFVRFMVLVSFHIYLASCAAI